MNSDDDVRQKTTSTYGMTNRFKHFPMAGTCLDCDSVETMYVGETVLDEQCCSCGCIVGSGYVLSGSER